MAGVEAICVVMIGCGNFSRRYHVPTLEAKAVVEAFRRWDSEVGAQKTK